MILNSIPKEKILPALLMLIDIGAAVMYIPSGDWRQIGYWIAAAVLTFCVTF